jgi:hypothetical protein
MFTTFKALIMHYLNIYNANRIFKLVPKLNLYYERNYTLLYLTVLKYLQQMTSERETELRFDLMTTDGTNVYETFRNFNRVQMVLE